MIFLKEAYKERPQNSLKITFSPLLPGLADPADVFCAESSFQSEKQRPGAP